MNDETITQMENRLNDEHIYKMLEGHEARLAVANSEMGAVKTSMGIISTDVAWLKEAVGKLDNRLWIILSVIILGTLIQIAMRLL